MYKPIMSVYLIRIMDRPWGFRIVSVVAKTKEEALAMCQTEYGSQSTDRSKRDFAEVHGECQAKRGNLTFWEFQE